SKFRVGLELFHGSGRTSKCRRKTVQRKLQARHWIRWVDYLNTHGLADLQPCHDVLVDPNIGEAPKLLAQYLAFSDARSIVNESAEGSVPTVATNRRQRDLHHVHVAAFLADHGDIHHHLAGNAPRPSSRGTDFERPGAVFPAEFCPRRIRSAGQARSV